MAGKILIDTNVLLDYLLEREPFFEDAKTIQAKAILSSGSRTLERFVTMTIQPEFGVPNRLQILKDAVLGD